MYVYVIQCFGFFSADTQVEDKIVRFYSQEETKYLKIYASSSIPIGKHCSESSITNRTTVSINNIELIIMFLCQYLPETTITFTYRYRIRV